MKHVLIFILMLAFVSGCATKWNVKYGIPESELYKADSVPKYMEALKDEDPGVRVNAIRFLYRFADPAIMETLKQIAQSDSSEKVRDYAQRAIKASKAYTGVNRVNAPAQLSVGESKVEIGIQPSSVFFTGDRNVVTVAKYGLLPIQIKFKNLSETPLAIDPLEYKLIMPSGAPVNVVSPDEVNDRLRLSYKGPIISTVMFPPLAIGIWTRANTNQRIGEQVRQTQVNYEYIPKGQAIEGYVFFDVPKNLVSLENWKLQMGIRNERELYTIEDTFFRDITARKPAEPSRETVSVKNEPAKIPDVQPARRASKQEAQRGQIEKASLEQKLTELDNLRKKGLITQGDYDKKKADLLHNF